MRKQKLLADINYYIAQVSNLNPAPVDYIACLHTFKALVQTATNELAELEDAWRIITETYKNTPTPTLSSEN